LPSGTQSPFSFVLDLLALGAEVEVLHPPGHRAEVARAAQRIAGLHAGDPA